MMGSRTVGAFLLAAVLGLGACSSSSPTDVVDEAAGGFPAGVWGSSECARVAQAMGAAAAGAAASITGTFDESVRTSTEAIEAAADAAPAEIKGDMQILAAGYADFVDAIQDIGWDPSSGQPPTQEQAQRLEAAADLIDTPAFNTAAERVDTYFSEKCGDGS